MLEELFFLHPAKHRGFKNNLIQSIYFRFRIQNHWRPNQEFFWTHSSTLVNVALSYEKWLTNCFSQWTQIGDKECYKLLSYIISYTVKMLRLTVTSRLGTFWKGGGEGGAGAFGELCAPLKKSWLCRYSTC